MTDRRYGTEVGVENKSFLIENTYKDTKPLQWVRELTQNAIEAVLATREGTGLVVWDYDPITYADTGVRKARIYDTGRGMTPTQMEDLLGNLSASIHKQAIGGNYGLGAKISSLPRNPEGMRYMSWQAGQGYMINIIRNPKTGKYCKEAFDDPDREGHVTEVVPIVNETAPEAIRKSGWGTVCVLHGKSPEDSTYELPDDFPSDNKTRWVRQYLNQHFFTIPAGVTIKVRDSVEHDGPWDRYSTVVGKKAVLDERSIKRGVKPISGARVYWWIMDPAYTEKLGPQATKGHSALIYQNELYNVTAQSNASHMRLKAFGITEGTDNVILYVEPSKNSSSQYATDVQRSRVHYQNGKDLPWSKWQQEFRDNLPPELEEYVKSRRPKAYSSLSPNKLMYRLQDRVKDLKRLRADKDGPHHMGVPNLPGTKPAQRTAPPNGAGGPSGTTGGTSGKSTYSQALKKEGTPARKVRGIRPPSITFQSVNPQGSHESLRPAGYLDGMAAGYIEATNTIDINLDFRGFRYLIDYLANRNSDLTEAEDHARELVKDWAATALFEAVVIAGSLGGDEWSESKARMALSEYGLTLAVLPAEYALQVMQAEMDRRILKMPKKTRRLKAV